MKKNSEFPATRLTRSLAAGVIIAMLLFYFAHVHGEWKIENYRPNPETTSTLLLQNKCILFGTNHTLRPNTGISAAGSVGSSLKYTGSFMNFTEGHISAMAVLAVLVGLLLFGLRTMLKKPVPGKTALFG